MKNSILLAISIMIFGIAQSQVRREINTYSQTERQTLATLMQEYITLEVVQRHCDYTVQSGNNSLDIHDHFNFLPFHRTYIEDMEDFMLLNGHPEFVPFPKWSQTYGLPSELQIIDDVCSSISSTDCANTFVSCSANINWNPNNPIPNNLTTNIQSGSDNDICDHQFSPVQPGQSNINGLSRKIESPYHNRGHGFMGGAMGTFTSPVVLAFWLWHSHIDDVWKSWEQNCPQSTTAPVDLYMKDRDWIIQEDRDRGEEPNIDEGSMWLSNDIWIRNQADGFTTDVHEDPIARTDTAVYVYVRIRNRGFQSSLGSEQIELRWAKAATSLGWPQHWNGSMDLNPGQGQALAGDIIDAQPINSIKAQGHTIVEFIWYPPNPSDYNGINTEPWHFCLLARIVASNDPMTFNETGDLNGNVRNNNNIVWKNVNIIDNIQGIVAGGGCTDDVMQSVGDAVAVGNPLNEPATFDLRFEVPKEDLPIKLNGVVHQHDFLGNSNMVDASTLSVPDRGIAVTQEGMVIIALDEGLYNKWQQGGSLSEGLKEINPHNTLIGNLIAATPLHDILFDEHRKLFEVTDIKATFKNISFEAGAYHTTSMMVLYPTTPESSKEVFIYDVIQTNTATGKAIGGVRYDIRKPDCTSKFVGAGVDRVVKKGCATTLAAAQQFACATYRWMDDNGNVISREPEVTVAPLTNTTYNLYVVSNNGCASTDEVKIASSNQLCQPVDLPQCFSEVIVYPNPANGPTMQVQINAEEAVEAKIEIRNGVLGFKLNETSVSLDTGINTIPVDISDLPIGTYQIRISCPDQADIPYIEMFTKM